MLNLISYGKFDIVTMRIQYSVDTAIIAERSVSTCFVNETKVYFIQCEQDGSVKDDNGPRPYQTEAAAVLLLSFDVF